MTNPIKKIIGALGEKAGTQIVDTIGKTVDTFVTTDKERIEAKQQLIDTFVSYQSTIEQEVTKRHQADMQSDNWLSKNIRPLLLIYAMLQFTFFSFFDGNVGGFTIKDSYVALLGQIISLGLMFYFGSRGVEKISKAAGGLVNKKKKNQE